MSQYKHLIDKTADMLRHMSWRGREGAFWKTSTETGRKNTVRFVLAKTQVSNSDVWILGFFCLVKRLLVVMERRYLSDLSFHSDGLFMVRSPWGRRGVLSFFQVCVFFESLISFHVLHGFLVLLCIFCCFYCVSWRASCYSWVVGMPVFFGGVGWGVGWGGVGGLGGCWGGVITFLFINVPASAFLTRFSLLQVTVWRMGWGGGVGWGVGWGGLGGCWGGW